MQEYSSSVTSALPQLPKAPTGIEGLDEITEGGLPLGRPTLICGSAGCGKTLMGIEFLVRGILDYNEPGVLMAFEETGDEPGRQRGLSGLRPEGAAGPQDAAPRPRARGPVGD
ncbi:ATPase domain-containing protein [Hymenobacter humi]|uniref:ATPase domain-containing protein n=1 Tax=Hymenobacter humi TaxID=1411620 RepID=A0ABW2U3Z1_9BACT